MKCTLTQKQLQAIEGLRYWSNHGKHRTYIEWELWRQGAGVHLEHEWSGSPYIDHDNGDVYKEFDEENASILNAYLQEQYEKVGAAYEKAQAEKQAEEKAQAEKNATDFREELFAEARVMTDEDWTEAQRKGWDGRLHCISVRQYAGDYKTTEEVHERLSYKVKDLKGRLEQMIKKLQGYSEDWYGLRKEALCAIHYIDVYEKALGMERQEITEWARDSKDSFVNHRA